MLRKSKTYLFVLLFGNAVVALQAQDLHFSQYFNTPLLVNPANTGFIPDADYRLTAGFRNQWASVTPFPYKTITASGDWQLNHGRDNTGWLGLGGFLLRDVAGTSVLTSTKLYGSVAYHQMINAGSLVSLGFNFGWSNKQINTTHLTFPSQWNGKFFDIRIGTIPQFRTNNIHYFDMQVGMNYAYFPNNHVYLNAGFSAMHVNRPKETFFDENSGVDNRVPVRYTGFLNGSFKLNDLIILNPNVYASVQARASEITGGMNIHYNASGDGEKVLIGGLYYRYGDALIPMIGLSLYDFTFTFSYDITHSSLRNFNNSRGGFEFTLVKRGVIDRYKGNKRESLCPTFRE
ncbi:MAG: PorP/SprF family type IX secretion system membrane protein [Chitinophagaceae bacterium]|nr:PorP/SprF family type IX secretion system membrane protein [Chitinophagaceae bacterium]